MLAPDLVVDLQQAAGVFGVLDGAGSFAFSFVPAPLGLGGLTLLAQAGTYDPVLGLRASNCDVRAYGF